MPSTPIRYRRCVALVILALLMIGWGGTFVVTKAAALEIPPMTLAMLRYLTAVLALLPFAIVRGGFKHLPQPIPWRSLWLMALIGIVLYTITFNYALVYASATQGSLIYAAVPASVAIVATQFLGESISKRRALGIFLSMLGVGLVIVTSADASELASRPVLGAVLMMAAVLCFAAYTVIAKRLATADQVLVVAVISILGTLILLPLSAWELAVVPWPRPTWRGWAGVIFLGVAASALAFIAFGYVLRVLEASVVGAFTNLDPIVGVITAVLLLGEPLQAGLIVGGSIALVGMWLASLQQADEGAGTTALHER